MTDKATTPALELRSATFDMLTARMSAMFSDDGGNMITVNSAIVPAGKDQAKAVRAALVALLRQAADTLEAVDQGASGAE